MLKRSLFCFMLGCSALLAASCTTRSEPKDDPPGKDTPIVKEKEAPPAKADPREVTILVDGMSERLKLV
jgi:hypothetical protein